MFQGQKEETVRVQWSQNLCPPQKPHSSTQGTFLTFGCLYFCFVVIFL